MIHKNFDAALEKDIAGLSQEILRRQEKAPSPEFSQREILKTVIQEKIQAQPSPAPTDDAQSSVLPQYLQEESPEVRLKVEELVEMTLHKGIDAAIAEAKKYGPFILDALHDTLTSKIYEELKSRKLI